MSFWMQYGFPDPNTEMAGRLYMYHDLVLVVVIMVLVWVGWFLFIFIASGRFFGENLDRYLYSDEVVETVWTIVPAFFLIGLGYVSLKNLYDMEVGDNVDHVVKVTGHQWYWEYRYEVNFSKVMKGEHKECLADWLSSFSVEDLVGSGESSNMAFEAVSSVEDFSSLGEKKTLSLESVLGGVVEGKASVLNKIAELFMVGDWFLKYDSYLVPESDLVNKELNLKSGFRNQDVSAPCYLAHSKKNEVLVSTADVMHSWGVSELGVKADAVPGRSNSLSVEPLSAGVAFGNCYELCGEGHSQMPVVVFVSNYDDIIWALKKEIMVTECMEDFVNKME